MDKLAMLQWQQEKDTGVMSFLRVLPLDVVFFLLDRTYPPGARKQIAVSAA
jgi:hypothetical protein